jgi:hypothetical protein
VNKNSHVYKMSDSQPYINCRSVKKRVFNYSTNNASTRTFPTIGILANIFKNASYTTLTVQLNPFKSYSGSISGFGTAIKNKF